MADEPGRGDADHTRRHGALSICSNGLLLSFPLMNMTHRELLVATGYRISRCSCATHWLLQNVFGLPLSNYAMQRRAPQAHPNWNHAGRR